MHQGLIHRDDTIDLPQLTPNRLDEAVVQDANDSYWTPEHERQRAAFDEIAQTDYRVLRERFAWGEWFERLEREAQGADIRVLDAACGPAHFTASVFDELPPLQGPRAPIHVDLLDISPYSLEIAQRTYAQRWASVGRIHSRLQDYVAEGDDAYDLILSVHGLYTHDRADFAQTLLNLLLSLRSGGTLLLVQATTSSHYIAWDRALLADGFFPEGRTPYLTSEDILSVLDEVDLTPDQVIECRAHRAMDYPDHRTLDDFLRWCAFDDRISSQQVLAPSGAQRFPRCHEYLNSRRGPHGPTALRWQLDAQLLVIQRSQVSLQTLRRLANRVLQRSRPGAVAPLSAAAYALAQDHFERSSDQRPKIVSSVSTLLQHPGIIPSDGTPLEVASLGCGDGSLDADILGALHRAEAGPARTEYTGVEVSPTQCDRFQHARFELPAGEVSVKLHNEDVDQLDWTTLGAPHLVWAIHSHYYFADAKAVVMNSLQQLRPGGALLVACAPQGELNELSSLTWSRGDEPIAFTDDVLAWLTEAGIPFATVRVEASLHAPGATIDEHLLRFIFQVEIDRREPYLHALLNRLVLAIRDERHRVPHPVDLVWIGARPLSRGDTP